MNILSLFDWMSCWQIAINKLWIKEYTYFASEIDKSAIEITQKNYPNTIQIWSVLDIKWEEYSNIDLFIWWSPCQWFSFAWKQLNFDDPRSRLFFEYVRILKETKPKYFLLENVKMRKEYEDIITEQLFWIAPIQINSNLVSAWDRKRLYWVWKRQDDWTYIKVEIEQPEDRQINLSSIIEENVSDEFYLTDYQIKTRIKWMWATNWFWWAINNWRDKAYTLLASYSKSWWNWGKWKDEKGVRTFTPTECEKLQTVPLNYTEWVSVNKRWHMLWNWWTVDVIVHILSYLLKEELWKNNI